MKIGAGLTAILVGMSSLFYVGVIGGMIGHAAGWLGSVGPPSQGLNDWAAMVSTLSWLSPLLAIVGGIVTISAPRFGGVIIAGSAFAHWSLLGSGIIGNSFVLPLGAASLLALLSPPSRPRRVISTPDRSEAGTVPESSQSASLDQAKWNALLQYDTDIASVADRIRPLGQKWLDEFGSAFLALNDKAYLSQIEDKIIAAAKAEAAQAMRDQAAAQEKLLADAQEETRLAEERKLRRLLWRARIWGSTPRKIATGTSLLCVLGIAAVLLWPKKYSDPFAYCKAVGDRDLTCVECGDDSPVGDTRYVGPSMPRVVISALRKKLDMPSDEFPAVWRCMNGNIWGCYLGASGRACTQPDTSVEQRRAIGQFCVPCSPRYPPWLVDLQTVCSRPAPM